MTVDARETHISQLFFTPDRVYKILKAVATPYLDFIDPDNRILAATTEFDVNARLAPDVYLGTADVDEGGRITERMIVMRRLPDDRQLSRLVNGPDAAVRVWETAKHIAALHAAEPPITDQRSDAATGEMLARRWEENFDSLRPLVGTVIDEAEHQAVTALVDRYLAGRHRLFAERIAEGWVRDGHGDLRAEHVFCLDDGPRVIDCLAFRDDFRIVDVLNDVAFLAMDLHRLAGPEPARTLIHDYCEFSYEHHPSTLAHHYVAYRAAVRAKVAAVRLTQGDESAAGEVASYHRLAHEHLSVGRVRLVMVGGSVGVGKSTVARGLADSIGATWLRSDEVRKAGGGDRPVRYTAEAKDAVYRELIDQGEALLSRGESVVLDARWATHRRRAWVRDLAARTNSDLSAIQVTAPLDVACARLRTRQAVGDDPSDATPELARQLHGEFEDWPEASEVSSDRTITETVADAVRSVLGPTAVPTTSRSRCAPVDYTAVRFYLRRAGTLVPEADYLNRPVRP